MSNWTTSERCRPVPVIARSRSLSESGRSRRAKACSRIGSSVVATGDSSRSMDTPRGFRRAREPPGPLQVLRKIAAARLRDGACLRRGPRDRSAIGLAPAGAGVREVALDAQLAAYAERAAGPLGEARAQRLAALPTGQFAVLGLQPAAGAEQRAPAWRGRQPQPL